MAFLIGSERQSFDIKTGYNMGQLVCMLGGNPIMVNNIASLFHCTPADRTSDLIGFDTKKLIIKAGWRLTPYLRSNRGSADRFVLLQCFRVGLSVQFSPQFSCVSMMTH